MSSAPLEEVRTIWRRLVRDCHPDAMVARGVPVEARKLAESRLAAINEAWDEIRSSRAGPEA